MIFEVTDEQIARANVQVKRTSGIATAGWLVNDLRPI